MQGIINSRIVLHLLLVLLTIQTIAGHGDGGSAEVLVDNYLIDMKYSEKPLNTIEPVLFILSLKNATTNKPITFTNMQLKLFFLVV